LIERPEPTPRSEWISRILSTVVAAGYFAFWLSIASAREFVGFIPVLGLALLCTCFPKIASLGRTSNLFGGSPPLFGRYWWRASSPVVVLAGGWVLLLLPGVIGTILWLSRRS